MSSLLQNRLSPRLTAVLFAAGALLGAPRAHAQIDGGIRQPIFDYVGVTTSLTGRTITPNIKISIGGESERAPVSTTTAGPYGPTLTAGNPDGGQFLLQISMTDENGQTFRLFPPGPCKDGTCQNVNVLAVASDGTSCSFTSLSPPPIRASTRRASSPSIRSPSPLATSAATTP